MRRFERTGGTSMELPDTVEVLSGPEPRGSVIWLHGLGADGHDFEPIHRLGLLQECI